MVIAAGYTHKGKRKNNEDCFVVSDSFAIVADGMGGHSKGEIASSMAVEHIKDCLKGLPLICEQNIIDSITSANKIILDKSVADDGMSDMGTTVVMCSWQKDKVIVANVGDSRCYLCSKDKIKQITTDHSYVQSLVDSGKITPKEAENRTDKNIILRAVGCEENIEVDIFKLSIKKGDILLLCSDGLSGAVPADDIKKISQCGGDVAETVKLLVNEAYKNGATDNITAVLVKFE